MVRRIILPASPLGNPVIVEAAGEQTGAEACLSFPGYFGTVARARRVVVEALNRKGERISIEAEGELARCMQHEIDHLDGVLFVDRMTEKWLYRDGGRQKIGLLDVIRLTNRGE